MYPCPNPGQRSVLGTSLEADPSLISRDNGDKDRKAIPRKVNWAGPFQKSQLQLVQSSILGMRGEIEAVTVQLYRWSSAKIIIVLLTTTPSIYMPSCRYSNWLWRRMQWTMRNLIHLRRQSSLWLANFTRASRWLAVTAWREGVSGGFLKVVLPQETGYHLQNVSYEGAHSHHWVTKDALRPTHANSSGKLC